MSTLTIHLTGGKDVKVEGDLEEVRSLISGSRGGLVTIGDVTISPDHVTHTHKAKTGGASFM